MTQHISAPGCAHTICTTIDIRGDHRPDALVAACHATVAATPPLRLRFGIDPVDGTVRQWFATGTAELILLPATPDPTTDPAVDTAIDEQVDRPFIVDGGGLVRFVVAPGAGAHRIAVVTHHLVIDGASQPALVHRLARAVAGDCPVEPESAYRELVAAARREEELAAAAQRDHWSAWLAECARRGALDQLPPAAAPDQPSSPVRRFQSRITTERLAGGSLFTGSVRAVVRALRDQGRHPPIVVAAASVRPPGAPPSPLGYFVNLVPMLVLPGSPESAWRAGLRHRTFPFAALVTLARLRSGRPDLRLDEVCLTYRRLPRRLAGTIKDTRYEADLGRPSRGTTHEVGVRVFHDPEGLEVQVMLSGGAAVRNGGGNLAAEVAGRLAAEQVPA